MAERRYRVLLEAEREGGFHAYLPELPGVHSHGDTREQALENVEDAARLYLADLKAEGEEPPPPAEETHIRLSA
jgi:antitoxin HicB